MEDTPTIKLDNREFVIVKPTRLRDGMVLYNKTDNLYARLGEKQATLEEQIHTISLKEKGFPVPTVISSGSHEDAWYFVENSLGEKPFHKIFVDEYEKYNAVSDESFKKYFDVIALYTQAQMHPKNSTRISAAEFIEILIPNEQVVPSLAYFNHDIQKYQQAITQATAQLSNAHMGVLQFDLNPYNILENGVIDFELVGYGPVGYDSLMSAVWGGTWFTDYPSRYPVGYRLSPTQVKRNTKLVDRLAEEHGHSKPSAYLNEFLLLKTAWALSDPTPPQPDCPDDMMAFRRFRANVLAAAVDSYVANDLIDYQSFSKIPGGEIVR